MKRLLMTTAALALLTTTAQAASFRADDIARLPQDKVASIKRYCASEWDDNFRMREYCENNQFEALQRMIERGSVSKKGETL